MDLDARIAAAESTTVRAPSPTEKELETLILLEAALKQENVESIIFQYGKWCIITKQH